MESEIQFLKSLKKEDDSKPYYESKVSEMIEKRLKKLFTIKAMKMEQLKKKLDNYCMMGMNTALERTSARKIREDVKKAVLKSEENNLVWINSIYKIINTNSHRFTENEMFNLKTSLDGLERQNNDEVFGKF